MNIGDLFFMKNKIGGRFSVRLVSLPTDGQARVEVISKGWEEMGRRDVAVSELEPMPSDWQNHYHK